MATPTEAALADALSNGAWPQLRQLQLLHSWLQRSDSPLSPALARLGSLTSLSMSQQPGSSSSEVNARLPASLQHLELYQQGGGDVPPLALGHLTSLSALQLHRAVADADALPASLVALTASCEVPSVAPLLALPQLTRLALELCQAGPDKHLAWLSGLRRLAHLRLHLHSYTSDAADAWPGLTAVSAGWGALPLRELSLVEQYVAPGTLQHLRGCSVHSYAPELRALLLRRHAGGCRSSAGAADHAAGAARDCAVCGVRQRPSSACAGCSGRGGGKRRGGSKVAGQRSAVLACPRLRRCELSNMDWQQMQPLAPLLASPLVESLWLQGVTD